LSSWTDKVEGILTDLGISYDYRTYSGESIQLPERYIVYFLVDDNGKTYADGKETSHSPRIQISFYFKDKADCLTIPDQITTAFIAANFMRVGSSDLPYSNETEHYGWRVDFRINERR